VRSPALFVLCSFALACGGGTPEGKQPTVGRSQSAHPAPPIAELPEEFRGQVPTLQHSAVLSTLPDSTMAAIIGKSPSHLATSMESVEILREYPEFFAEYNVALNAALDAKLLEPASWSKLGIDVDSEIGAAFIVHKRAVGLFFASLHDTQAFRASVPHAAQVLGLGKVHQSSVGERHIFRFQRDDEIAVLVNAKSAVLILADRKEDLDRVVADLLGTSGNPTLAESGRLAKSFTGFDYGEDVTGFIAFDTFAARLAEDRNRSGGNNYWLGQLEELENRVEEAKSQAKPQAEIDALEERLAEVLKEYNELALRDTAEAHFTDSIVGTLGTVAFGLDIGDAATGIRTRIHATPKSFADRIFVSGGGPLQTPKRLVEEPLWMLAGHVDRIAALEILKTIVNMEGETMGSVASAARNEFQVDLSAWIELFGGEMSGAFTLNRDLLMTAKNSEQTLNAFGMHIMLGVRDDKAAQELLSKAMQSPALRQYVKGTGEDAVLEIESFNNRPVRITISNGFLDIRSVGETPTTPAWRPHETETVGSPQNLALFVFDPMLLQWLMFSDSYDSYPDHAATYRVDKTPNPTRDAKIAELTTQIDSLRDSRTVIRNARFTKGSNAFGRLVVSARNEPSGALAIFGSLVGTARNIGRAMQAVAESTEGELEEQRTKTLSPLRGIEAELHKLQAERSALHRSRY